MLYRIRWQIAIALTGFLIVLLLAGSLALSTAATSLPYYNRAYVEGVVGVPRHLNPLLQQAGGPESESDLTALLFEGLTRAGADGTAQPALAERWEIDGAGTTYTFTLRPGLRWHDGVALTANDVLFTVQSIQSNDFPGDAALAAFWRAITVDAIDDHRIQFTLPQPFAPFLGATTLPILPRHLLGDLPVGQWATAPFDQAPVGSGPFRLQSFDQNQATLRPFDGAARGRPLLDLLVLRFYPSDSAAHAALARREVEGVATEASGAEPVQAPHTKRLTLPLATYTTLVWNLREPPFDDQRMREALVASLDRAELVEQVFQGAGLPIDTPLLPQTVFHGAAQLPTPDRTTAERLLDEQGWQRTGDQSRSRDGTSLQIPFLITSDGGQRSLAEEIARQMQALGIAITIEEVDAATFRDRVARHEFTLILQTWTIGGGDPDVFALWHSSQADGGANNAGLADEQIDRLLVMGRTATDQDERIGIYSKFEQRWLELLPSLPLYQSVLIYDLDERIRPEGLDPTRLLMSRSARFDTIGGWTTVEE